MDEAEAIFQKALEIESQLEESVRRQNIKGRALNHQGSLEMERGNYEKAMELYQKLLEISLQGGDELLPSTATAYHNISTVHLHQGRLEDAVAISANGLKIRRRLLGDDHPNTQRHMLEHKTRLGFLLKNKRG